MQNKGFVKVFAVLLTLVCVFYLSFSFVTRHYMKLAAEDPKGETHFLDSMQNERVYLWNYTLKQCREMEIGLGLDLKGGMNVILEVSVPDVVKTLADHKVDEAFNKAVDNAAKAQISSQSDFITLFVEEYHKLAPGKKLAEIFATQQLKDKVTAQSTDAEVEKVLREEVLSAVENSYKVLRTRIDRFGVVQPNIQKLEGSMGRIMVELPGIKEPERVRKLLQGSANLEFWETFDAKEFAPYLVEADSKAAAILSTTAVSDSTATEVKAEESEKADDTNIADSLSNALKGNQAKAESTQSNEEIKKQHPLLSLMQVNQVGGGVVAYALSSDTAEINKVLAMPEVRNSLPREARLMWGVKAVDTKTSTFELYAIRVTERNGRAPLEGDVVTDAKDGYDQFGNPCVHMEMNSDGARRWAQLTKQNIGRAIAIVLDGYVYSAPNVQNEITGGSSQITGKFSLEDTKKTS